MPGSVAPSRWPRAVTSRRLIWRNPLQAQITNRSDAVDGLTRKDRSGPVLTFDPAVWSAFVDDIKAGEFDLPR